PNRQGYHPGDVGLLAASLNRGCPASCVGYGYWVVAPGIRTSTQYLRARFHIAPSQQLQIPSPCFNLLATSGAWELRSMHCHHVARRTRATISTTGFRHNGRSSSYREFAVKVRKDELPRVARSA